MFMVKDFWAVPEYAELLDADRTSACIRSSSAARARPRKRSNGLADDWDETFKKYKPSSNAARDGERSRLLAPRR